MDDNANFIAVKLNRLLVRCLVDTGAVKSCISLDLMRKLCLTPTQPSTDQPEYLVAASGARMPNIGTVDIEIFIQGLVIPFTFYVLKDLTHSCIFGMDLLTSTGANINLAQQCISFYDGLVVTTLINKFDRSALVRLSKSLVIPAKTEAIVPVKLHPKHRAKTSLMEIWPPIKNQMIAVAAAVVKPQTNETCCRVINLGITPRRLRAGTPIAVISALDLNDQHNQAVLNGSHTTEKCEASLMSLSTENTPPHAERVKVLEQKGFNFTDTKLPAEQFERLSTLLFNNIDLFADDVTQLPGSDLVLHDIEVTDHRPIRLK